MDTPVRYVSLKDAIELFKEQGVKVVRQRYNKGTIEKYLYQIQDETLRTGLLRLLDEYPFFKEAPAGARHHHWWTGGLEEHCCEMLGLGLDLMDLYGGDLAAFTKDDLIAAIFLHDFSKVFLYRRITPEEREKRPNRYKPQQEFTGREGGTEILDAENLTAVTLMKYGIPLTEKQWSAVIFAEGGFAKARFGFGGMPTSTHETVSHGNPLAAFVSMLDAYSALLLGRELR